MHTPPPLHSPPAYTNSSHIMCKNPFSGSLVLLLPLLHRFAPLVSFQTHSDLARTHTHARADSLAVTDARLSHSSPTCQKWKWQLGEEEKKIYIYILKRKKKAYRAVFAIKAGVVSFENVAFLKIVRPVILDVLREFLIGSVGGWIHRSFSGSLIYYRYWRLHMLTQQQRRKFSASWLGKENELEPPKSGALPT